MQSASHTSNNRSIIFFRYRILTAASTYYLFISDQSVKRLLFVVWPPCKIVIVFLGSICDQGSWSNRKKSIERAIIFDEIHIALKMGGK